jgi:putative phosphoesterase
MSDSHGDYFSTKKIAESEADVYIHLGDGLREAQRLAEAFPEKKILYVKGNCDGSDFDTVANALTLELEGGNKLIAVHGHLVGVRFGLDGIKDAAKASGANIAVFGHNHRSLNTFQDGIYIVSPGSCSSPHDTKPPSYAFIDITDAGVVPGIVYF